MPPLLYETHMHTPLCKHAEGEPEDYAAVAEHRGLQGIIVTCHNPVPGGWAAEGRMAVEQFDQYVALVERARQTWAGRVDVRLGLESDYAPGMEPWLEKLHARAPFHHVLGSVHPHLREYQALYLRGNVVEFQKTYFTHLAMAAETGLFDTIAHPDLVKNVFPDQWHPQSIIDHIRHCLDRIARTGVAMELNTSGLHKAIPEMNPGPKILAEMHRRNIPVVIGADAHKPERVGADYEMALELLATAGYARISLFLERKRREVRIADAKNSLRSLVAVPGGG